MVLVKMVEKETRSLVRIILVCNIFFIFKQCIMSSIWYLKSPSADMSWTDALDQLGFESNDVYKYIYTLDNIYINLRKINFILENFICLNKDLYISISCYPEKIFKKEINKNIFETIYHASMETSYEIALNRYEQYNKNKKSLQGKRG